jgi:isopentenyldiphosphate isomerase
MSDDLIEQAEQIEFDHIAYRKSDCESRMWVKAEAFWYDEMVEVIPKLIAEIKCLREYNAIAKEEGFYQGIESIKEQLAANDAINNDLMTNCNQLRDRCWKAESEVKHLREQLAEVREEQENENKKSFDVFIFQKEQLVAKDIELARWQEIAIEERAKSLVIYPDTWDDLYEVIRHPKTNAHSKDYYREQAAKELGIQISQENDGDNLTIAYMLGGKKADERLNVLLEYVKRLEAEFLELKEDQIRDHGPFYHVATITGQKMSFDLEKQREMAQAALVKIRESK